MSDRTDEEREFIDTALAAVDAGNAGHWPTVAGWLADEVRRLRALEAPVRGIAEGGGITEDAVIAVHQSLLDQWTESRPMPILISEMRIALRAALPLLGLQQVPTALLDRNAVRLAIADELDGEGVVSYGLAPKLTDRVMDVAQQVPSREEIAEAMHDHWTTTHKWRQGCREDVCIEIFLDRADAVLALFSKPAEEGS